MTNVAVPTSSYRSRSDAPFRTTWVGSAWGPVLAGAVTAIAVQMLFTVLGMAIGISVVNPGAAGSGADAGNIGVAAGVWWLITGTISLLLGGAVLGRLWGGDTRGTALHIHALTMWGVVTLFGFFVIWSGAGMVSEAAAPAAAITATTGMDQGAVGDRLGTGAATGEGSGVTTFQNRPLAAEEAADNAQAASWWSLIGLIIGIAASVIGAHISAKSIPDRRDHEVAT